MPRSIRHRLDRRRPDAAPTVSPRAPAGADEPVKIAPGDPLLAYLESAGGPVEVDAIDLDSPALQALRDRGVKLAVPLVSHGELLGVLNLGARRSEQDYSGDDRRLLGQLATQASPALRVAQLVREQEAEAVTRQRFEQELEVARLIQQNFLPQELPDLPGWEIAAYYKPAREVGGDFYDVIPLPDNRVAFVVGDVTDKGVPAALVMSATRSVLRGAAVRLLEPGRVLEYVNDHLVPDMPAKMFVTCLYGVLDPRTGHLRFANAGHDVPYVKTADGVAELRARGMPLGLMPEMRYEEKETTLEPGDSVLLHSDGIVEAHDPAREMFGFPRLKETVASAPVGRAMIDRVLGDLDAFTGPDHEQEDDITMVSLTRVREELLARFDVASARCNEREVMERVAEVVTDRLDPARLDRLKTAVAEAAMNAMEHGNGYRADAPVHVEVRSDHAGVRVRIADDGGDVAQPVEAPDIEAKLAGRQTPRGWGLFLIEKMVDGVRESVEDGRHVVELVMRYR